MLSFLGWRTHSERKRPREEKDEEEQGEAKRVLLDELLCPVCATGPLLPPVRQCPNGHLLCDPCSKQPACAKCPTCRCSPTNIRNLALEKIASASGLTAPCPHCGSELPFAEFSEHTASCRARPALWLKSSLSAIRGPSTRSRARRTGQHEAPDLVLSPMRPIAFGRSSAHSTRRLGDLRALMPARSLPRRPLLPLTQPTSNAKCLRARVHVYPSPEAPHPTPQYACIPIPRCTPSHGGPSYSHAPPFASMHMHHSEACTRARAHAHICACTQHAHSMHSACTHARVRARTHAHMYARIHARRCAHPSLRGFPPPLRGRS